MCENHGQPIRQLTVESRMSTHKLTQSTTLLLIVR
tara:strand:+ start:413 stop:517 length:105 start_codon:yes stop_codon:yes gene_type:complete